MGGRPTEATMRSRRRLVTGIRARVETENIPIHEVMEALRLSRQTVVRYLSGESFPTRHDIVERAEQFIRAGKPKSNGVVAPSGAVDLESYKSGFADGYARGRRDSSVS